MAQSQPPSQLARSVLELPDKALLAVLRCLAPDYNHIDLFSAARTCSELQQLSAAALTSISATVTQQHQVASLRLYLARHSRHVKSLCLYGGPAADGLLDELPPGLQLDRLSLSHLRLQLLRVGSSAGLLPLGTSVKQLEINYCNVCDDAPDAALTRALSQLPQLEHITYRSAKVAFPRHVLPRLQQLTSLHVIHAPVDILGFLHLTPGLRDLKASLTLSSSINSTNLSALQHLTSLCLEPAPCFKGAQFSPAGLANKHHLQRLQIKGAKLAAGGAASVAELMSYLQQMTQLTHLELPGCWDLGTRDNPSRQPASVFSALTASSNLQHLDVSGNTMPHGVWQHVLPAGRQLPHLRVLQALNCGGLASWAHADTARLASCCPNLQELAMLTPEPVAADALQPLQDLAALTALEAGDLDNAGLAAAARLTQLRRLRMWKHCSANDTGLLQLTQLRQLSILVSSLGSTGVVAEVFGDKGCDGVPVWRQVPLHCLQSKQPGVAQLAHCACWQQAAASSEKPAQ